MVVQGCWVQRFGVLVLGLGPGVSQKLANLLRHCHDMSSSAGTLQKEALTPSNDQASFL